MRPLQRVTADVAGRGTLSVLDGAGREYVRVPAAGRVSFTAGGAAGTQTVRELDATGRVVASESFVLEPRTQIDDAGGRMKELLRVARRTLERPNDSGTPTGVGTLEWRGETFHYYVPWLRDHVHTMKGMKYFDGQGSSFIDFFRETQKENGMIWDFFDRGQLPSFYETAYGPLGYARRYDGVEMVRMPAEADVEYLFVEGLFYAWKSNADDAWMERQLDAAVRAMDYSFTDRARFSTKYGLVKRGYTIDTWDFQIDDATTTSIFPRWGTLLVDPDRSTFGVMFGDNTGYAAACGYLAEMLERAGRPQDASRFRERGRDVRARLDRLSWLGTHFRHWVPEDETVVRDVGVDERAQVSLSNTYSLNRGISHEQAAAIVRTYQKIRGSLPPGSPGEWYAIYPPFEKGFADHSARWQYVNGGVSPIFAGELARGAFVHGFESYAADVLSRVLDLSKSSGDQIWFAYTGAYPPIAEPRFTPVDLSRLANMDLGGKGAPGVPSWMAAMPDDHLGNLPTGRQTFEGVPFLVADPAASGRRGAVAVSRRKGFVERVSIPVGATAGSVYLLHSVGNAGNQKIAGAITFAYDDGTDATQYAVQDRNVSGWWYPSLEGSWPGGYGSPRNPPLVKLAWRGRSDVCPNVGHLLVRSRQPASREAHPVDRPFVDARRRHLRGRRPDARGPAPPPEAAGRVVRRARQLGGGGDRVRARRGRGRGRRPRRRLPDRDRRAAVAGGEDERGARRRALPGVERLRGLRLPPRPGEARDRDDGDGQRREGAVPRAAARRASPRPRPWSTTPARRSPSRRRASSRRRTPTSRSRSTRPRTVTIRY